MPHTQPLSFSNLVKTVALSPQQFPIWETLWTPLPPPTSECLTLNSSIISRVGLLFFIPCYCPRSNTSHFISGLLLQLPPNSLCLPLTPPLSYFQSNCSKTQIALLLKILHLSSWNTRAKWHSRSFMIQPHLFSPASSLAVLKNTQCCHQPEMSRVPAFTIPSLKPSCLWTCWAGSWCPISSGKFLKNGLKYQPLLGSYFQLTFLSHRNFLVHMHMHAHTLSHAPYLTTPLMYSHSNLSIYHYFWM